MSYNTHCPMFAFLGVMPREHFTGLEVDWLHMALATADAVPSPLNPKAKKMRLIVVGKHSKFNMTILTSYTRFQLCSDVNRATYTR